MRCARHVLWLYAGCVLGQAHPNLEFSFLVFMPLDARVAEFQFEAVFLQIEKFAIFRRRGRSLVFV